MELRWIGPGDVEFVVAAGHLFDEMPTSVAISDFIHQPGHHLCIAYADNGEPIGFVTGIETLHPDKSREMLLYEITVHHEHRNGGVGRTLTGALLARARDLGCRGMWLLTDSDNHAALATYRATGASLPTSHVLVSWDLRA